MSQLGASVLGFEQLQPLYDHDKDFAGLYNECQRHPKGEFLIHEGAYLRAHGFVSLKVTQWNFSSVRFMEDLWPATLVKRRL